MSQKAGGNVRKVGSGDEIIRDPAFPSLLLLIRFAVRSSARATSLPAGLVVRPPLCLQALDAFMQFSP